MSKQKTTLSAVAGWLAGQVSRALRPAYAPIFVSPTAAIDSVTLIDQFEEACLEGFLTAKNLVTLGTKGKDALPPFMIGTNVEGIRAAFDKAAARMDPDGLASEIVRLFCVGVQHMDNLDNRRRVVQVWSAILAPSVALREHSGKDIPLERISVLARDWVKYGYTDDARTAYTHSDVRFVAAHPARIYDLLVDTAAQHGLDHAQLVHSAIYPVVMSVGQYVGAHGFTASQESNSAHGVAA